MSAQAVQPTTSYGSPCLARATACAHALRYSGSHTLADLTRALIQLPYLIGLLCLLPRTSVHLSGSPSGERIRAHLQLRRWGLPRFRLAQGVLHLPGEYATYLRGRPRQAVRTNIARARARGVQASHTVVSNWTPSDHLTAPAAPAERWQATNRAGALVGEAWLTVDDQCALLHSLTTSEPDVRWLLHTAIIERLCARGCRQLLTNSHDAFLMPAGQQYFQHRIGYLVEHLRLRPSPSPRISRASRPLAWLVILAGAAAVGEQALAGVL